MSLNDALAQRRDAMTQAAQVLTDRPAIPAAAPHVGVTEQATLRVLEHCEKAHRVQELSDARAAVQVRVHFPD